MDEVKEVKQHYPEVRVEEELQRSYLTYAMSVIVSRALPDVRDGLKPSQRRIMVAMNDLNLGPHAKSRKCAKIAGDTSGNYHPHGEGVIYPTLVRLAQPFNMRSPLIQGQGNFGSLDGDPPAAMRYTEARLTAVATEMMEDMEKNTVDYVPNYDDTRTEPVVLPGKFPNLLVNGSLGIAVGMATSIPPHNLREVCDAIVRVIQEPNVPLSEICKIIRGPDFPTGAIICGANSIEKAYTTGRSTVTVRARWHKEEARGGKAALIFSEIPFEVNKARLLEKIADLVKEGKIKGIADVRDESDRKEAVRIVVEIKRGDNEEVVLNQLFKFTQLQSSFSIIMIALVNGRPQLLNIKEMITSFIAHRKEVIRRRSGHLLERAEKRAHIVDGLLIAIQHIDAIITLLRQAEDTKQVKLALEKKYQLSLAQIEAILQMRLSSLTGLEYNKIQEEREELTQKIGSLRNILGSDKEILDLIKQETLTMRAKYGDDRRTDIQVEQIQNFAIEDIIPDNQWIVLVTHNSYIKRMSPELYRTQNRGGRGVSTADMNEGDFVEHFFMASAHEYILLFTDYGKVYWLKVYDIPESSRTAKGRAIINLLDMQEKEAITAIIPIREFDSRFLMMATARGIVKKVQLAAFSRPMRGGIRAITLEEGDRLIRTVLTKGDQDVVLGTLLGKACRFKEKDVRPLSRTAQGVIGVRLEEGDTIIGMLVVTPGENLLTICENGYGKCSPYDEYRITRRGSHGFHNVKRTEKTGNVVAILSVKAEDEIMVITVQGMVIRISASLPVLSRHTQGVRIIRLKAEGDRVVSLAKMAKELLEQKSGNGEETVATAATEQPAPIPANERTAEAANGDIATDAIEDDAPDDEVNNPAPKSSIQKADGETVAAAEKPARKTKNKKAAKAEEKNEETPADAE
jgi:DNA gyrase subunit A